MSKREIRAVDEIVEFSRAVAKIHRTPVQAVTPPECTRFDSPSRSPQHLETDILIVDEVLRRLCDAEFQAAATAR